MLINEPLYVSSIRSFNSRKLLSISEKQNNAELNENLKSKSGIKKATINVESKSKKVITKAKLNKNNVLENKPDIDVEKKTQGWL